MASPLLATPTLRQLKRFAGPRSGLASFLELGVLDVVRWQDDFFGDTVNTTYDTYTNNSGTVTCVSNVAGGQVLIDTIGSTNGDYISFFMPNKPCGGQYNSVIAARFTAITAVTDSKFEIGFIDSPTNTIGVVNALATPTFLATNGACWCYDTNDTGYWQAVGVMAGVGMTVNEVAGVGKIEPTYFGVDNAAPVASTYQWLIVALQGTAVRFIALNANGGQVYDSDWIEDGITAATAVSPYVLVRTRTTANKQARLDYFGFWSRRTTA